VGIAKVTMHQREYTVVLYGRGVMGLTVHTMYFVNEIRKVEGLRESSRKKIKLAARKRSDLQSSLWKVFPRISSRSNITTHIRESEGAD